MHNDVIMSACTRVSDIYFRFSTEEVSMSAAALDFFCCPHLLVIT